MHLTMITCFISGTILLAFVAGQAFQLITRKERPMANSSAELVAAFAPVAALVGTQAQTIADLKSKLAAITPEDPQVAADLKADEDAIAATIAQANALVAPASIPPVITGQSDPNAPQTPAPSPAPLAPAANSIADQLAAAEAAAGTAH